MTAITRRTFLKAVSLTAAGLAVSGSLGKAQSPQPEYLVHLDDPLGVPRIPPGPPPDHYDYHGWETLYKDQWTFDTFSRTAHSMNCTGNCTWRGYVKDGILFKEEQFADYPEIYTDVPCYNPRGCQKGANYKEYIYGPQRVKYPLIRSDYPGNPQNRGAGNFRRATWGEVLGLIAGKVVQTIQTPWADAAGVSHASSPDQVFFYAAIPAKHHLTLSGGFRLANLLGAPLNSFYDWYCDLPPGEPMTWGVQTDSCEGADWYRSNFIMLQGANLVETRIPDAHYFAEARYRGCKTVVVSPEYNAVSRMADVYVKINPGTDAALNLGMAREIVYKNLYSVADIQQFTDLPFLIYTSGPCKGKFVRTYDAQNGDGTPKDPKLFNQYRVYVNGQFVIPPGTMNNGGSLNITPAPELEVPPGTAYTYAEPGKKPKGKYAVKTAFTLLKEMLAPYTPAYVSGITGIPAQIIVELAHDFVNHKPARIIEGAGTNHWFHNDLTNRTQILILALTGNVGYPGSGFDHYVGQEKLWAEDGFFRLSFPNGRARQRFQNTTLWTYVHSETVSDVDNILPKPLSQYIADSVNKGWMPLWPKDTLTNGRPPKVLFIWGANYLNQAKGAHQVYSTLWPKLGLIVDLNYRMDTTARYADVILPAASYFEKFDINTSDLTPWVIPFTPVIDPIGESKPDWEIWRSLAEAIQATGFAGFLDDFEPFNTWHYPTNIKIGGLQRDFTKLLQQFDTWASPSPAPNPTTSYPPVIIPSVADQRDGVQWLLDNSPETKGMTIVHPGYTNPGDYRFQDMGQKDALPSNSIIKVPQRVIEASEEWTSDILPGEPYYGFQRMTVHRRPLRTQTGRQQFYLDHDWMLGLGEQLPVYKPPIDSDLPHPLRWITPHGRWSIHTSWRDAKYQLRLQRGRPIVYLSPNEAAARGLQDNDLVEIYNAHGALQAHLCIAARMPDGMAQMYHGWERHQFGAGAWQSATTIRINPTELIGKYGQMAFRLNYWGPTGNQKDTRVDIRLIAHEADNSGEPWQQDPCIP